jgi:hypothetical protein
MRFTASHQSEITMGFQDQVSAFTDKAKAALETQKEEVQRNAEKVLRDLLGDDATLVKSISLDADCGKFYDVVAPESVISKLRTAGLLKA